MLNELNTRLPKDQHIKLGTYTHSAGSYHVYERHWGMMNKIINNYRSENTGNYPLFNKWVLKPNITMGTIINDRLYLPYKDLTIKQIEEHTNKTMEEIYEK